MKFLFIHQYFYFEPLGLMSLSAVLKQAGHECFFIDTEFSHNVVSEVLCIKPDVIAYSVTTGMHRYFSELNLKIKQSIHFISLFGGPHCTQFPDFIEEEGVDIICRGEGDQAIRELADKLSENEDYTSIKNLWVKVNDQIFRNDIRNLIDNLDELPLPDRELIMKYEVYRKSHTRWVRTARGCPYLCSYCLNSVFNNLFKDKGKIIRRRSVAHVISELKQIKNNYRPRKIHFSDDTFNLNEDWVIELLELYKNEIVIPFIALIRLNLVTERLVKSLKDAGCFLVECGIESGNEHLRNDILKRNISSEQTLQASALFNKYGIKMLTLNIFGLPDETVDMAMETVYMNRQAKVSYASSTVFQPYPMTELADYAHAQGYYNGQINLVKKDYYFEGSILKMKDIKKLVRIHYLLNFFIKMPFLLKIRETLIGLPLDIMYKILFFADKSFHFVFVINKLDIAEIVLLYKNKLLKPEKAR